MFQHLIYEVLSDIIPDTSDGMAIVRRSRVWGKIKVGTPKIDWKLNLASSEVAKFSDMIQN